MSAKGLSLVFSFIFIMFLVGWGAMCFYVTRPKQLNEEKNKPKENHQVQES